MSIFDPIKSAAEISKQVKVSSILNSILWAIPFNLAALVFTDNSLVQKFLMVIIGSLILVLIFCFIGILVFGDPNLLRSENHVFLMKALDKLGDQSYIVKEIENKIMENNPNFPKPEENFSEFKQIKTLEKNNE